METVDLLILNAGELLTAKSSDGGAIGTALSELELVHDGAVAVNDGKVLAVGATNELRRRFTAPSVLDAEGALVSPALVDPHTHLVYGGSRHREYEFRITGRRPPRDLRSGINYTVARTREASDDDLVEQARADLDVMLAHGTTLIEAKSGYGLDRDTELRILRVLRDIDHPVDIVATYLGAHVLPEEFAGRREAYVDFVIATLSQARAYAEYCDVCCDPIGFTPAECSRIADAARRLGFRLKVHADQTGPAGGAELAAALGATSADHLDFISPEGLRAMVDAGTIGILLPGVTHHLMEMIPQVRDGELVPAEKPFLPLLVRRMVDAGMRLALSTDYNPGTSPTLSMQAAMQLAARLYRLSYAEVWHMSTINAAHAVDRGQTRGSLEVGKRADAVIWRVAEHGMVIDRFGTNLVDTVVSGGKIVVEEGVLQHEEASDGARDS